MISLCLIPDIGIRMRGFMKMAIFLLVATVLLSFSQMYAFEPLFDTRIDYPLNQSASFVYCADLNGDGFADMAVAPFYGDSISILINNGNGDFGQVTSYGTIESIISLSADDFDSDGDNDLAVIHPYANKLSILFNDGTGAFETNRVYTTDNRPSAVRASDLNDDGHDDIVITNAITDVIDIFFITVMAHFKQEDLMLSI